MRPSTARIAALGYDLPQRVVPSLEIEQRLELLYRRLSLSPGRLELMSGVRERRHYEPGTLPSQIAERAGRRALAASGIAAERIGLLIHASVCRDFLEPATAAVVHHALGLPASCAFYDLSNACLGFLNALLVAAQAIEFGQCEAALVVAGEDGAPLVAATVAALLAEQSDARRALKRAFASLTIGSGGAAAVVARAELAPQGMQLLGGVALSDSQHAGLCQGDRARAGGLLMETDSEALLHAGIALAERSFERFLGEIGWSRGEIERVITHQVGRAHRQLLLERLALPADRDFPTYEQFGNVGSVSLPLSLALACEAGRIERGQRVALLGIGSGLSCAMLGVIA